MNTLEEWLRENLPDTYTFEGICGSGGMGVVFRVRHRKWGIMLAVKVAKDATNPIDIQQFLQEAEIWADLGLHPYVATLYYVRELDFRLCTFSEYVKIGDMEACLRSNQLRGADDETTLSRILTLAASTAWGLHAAHSANLVHCDFKPGNVLVESDFTAKVADFGIARRIERGSFEWSGMTQLYASPEQIRSKTHKGVITAATDYWSWAATCFSSFIGGASWQSGAVVSAAFEDYMDNGAKSPGYPKIPDKFSGILRSCLAYQPSDRPDSFREIAQEICEIHSQLLHEPCPANPPDMELVAADSLNNRAVSQLDIGGEVKASGLLREALALDQYHPEAIFNYHGILQGKGTNSLSVAEKLLKESAALDSFNPIPWILLARLATHLGRQEDANRFLRSAVERGASESVAKAITANRCLVPVLAKPMSGDDFAFNKERFHRLINKAKNALTAKDTENANRYVLMAGDIPGFARHPDLHKLRAVLKS